MKKGAPPKNFSPSNVYRLDDARRKIDVRLKCTICKKSYQELIRWNTNLESLRCPTCVNPVDLLYPGETTE